MIVKMIQGLGKTMEKMQEMFTKALKELTEKAMAPLSSILAWKIPWMEEPVGLQSMG